MKTFQLILPCGAMNIRVGIHNLIPTIAHKVIQGELHQAFVASPEPETFMIAEHAILEERGVTRKTVKLRQTFQQNKLMRASAPMRPSDLVDRLMDFCGERFKEIASKKSIEFYVPDMNLEAVEKLAYKYLENFGSDSGTICLFKLSEYHKFAAIIDGEAFKIFRNEHGTHVELVELRPDRWVLGRYDNDLTIMKEMEGMRMYQPGTNSDG